MLNIFSKFYNIFSNHQKLIKKVEQLEEDSKAQSIFFNNASHEIRTPIHGICGILELLDQNWHVLSEEERKHNIELLSHSSNNLKSLLNNLLDFSKFQAGKMSLSFDKIDFLSLVEEVIQQYNKIYLLNENIKIIFEHTINEKLFIYADYFALTQVLNNLLSNAIKYTNSGIITIKVKIIPFDVDPIIEFSIIDQGIGLPTDELSSIFDPFIQSSFTIAKSRTRGTGLGLSICREIIEKHNGKIWAENNKSKGSRFVFTLPFYENTNNFPEKTTTAQVHTATLQQRKRTGTILFVDDEHICHDLIKLTFRQYSNFKIISAYTGAEAIRLATEHANEIDLILLDILLPDQKGIEVYNIIQQKPRLNKIPVIFQSGMLDIEDKIKEMIEDQKIGFIFKPYDKITLFEIIDKILKK